MFGKHRRELASWPYRVFLVGLAVMFEHLLEDAFVHEESGSSAGAKLGAAALALVLVVVGAAIYPLLPPRWRPLFVLPFGAIALLGGWQAHVSDALDRGASGGDYTGFLYALTGLVLIGLALVLAATALRARPASPVPRR
jgi:hypothetical protein